MVTAIVLESVEMANTGDVLNGVAPLPGAVLCDMTPHHTARKTLPRKMA